MMYLALVGCVVLFGLLTKRLGWRYPMLNLWFGFVLMLLILVTANYLMGGALWSHRTELQIR